MTSFAPTDLALLPVESTDVEVDRIVRDIRSNDLYRSAPSKVPLEQQLTFRAAQFLQDRPRMEIKAGQLAEALGINRKQASNVLQKFYTERTDVERVVMGVYRYVPGQGPGIKPRMEVPVVRSGKIAASRIQPPVELVYRPLLVGVPGTQAHTQDGRQIVADPGGAVYALTPL